MSKSVEFWYFRISRSAFTPGRKRFFFPFEMVLSMLTGWGAFSETDGAFVAFATYAVRAMNTSSL